MLQISKNYRQGEERYLSNRNTFQKTLLRSSASMKLSGFGSKMRGRKSGCPCVSSGSIVSCKYSTVLVRDPIIDHAFESCPPPIWSVSTQQQHRRKSHFTHVVKCNEDESLEIFDRQTIHCAQHHHISRSAYLTKCP